MERADEVYERKKYVKWDIDSSMLKCRRAGADMFTHVKGNSIAHDSQ